MSTDALRVFERGSGAPAERPDRTPTAGGAAAPGAPARDGAPAVAAGLRPDGRRRVRPLRVGPLELASNLVLAPMAGVTNLPFRLVARSAGAALVFTETVSAKGLATGGRKSWRLVETAPGDRPLAYQLFGCDAQAIETAARMLVDRGAVWIDLNLGCPVRKFIRNGAGSALLRNPPAVAPLVAAMRRANPRGVVSVKMRLGWDASSITAPEVARIAEAEGCDLVSVHGRTRAQMYSGRVDRRAIARVVESVRIPVLANGDVFEPADALSMLDDTGAAGVMIGRGGLANPWIFAQAAGLDAGIAPPAPDGRARAALVERHVDLMRRYFDDARTLLHMSKKYLCAYAHGLRGAGAFRDRVNRAEDLDRLLEEARAFFLGAAA